jgi:ABC-type amino acid transport substrate-binding protein
MAIRLHLEASAAQIEYVQDDQTNLRKLVARRIDYVALERLVGAYLLEQESPDDPRQGGVERSRVCQFAALRRHIASVAEWRRDFGRSE